MSCVAISDQTCLTLNQSAAGRSRTDSSAQQRQSPAFFPTSGRATDPGLIAARSSGSRQPSSPPAAAQPVTAGHGQPRQPQPLPRLLGTVTATRRSNPGRSPRLPCSCLPLPSRTDSSAQQRQSPAFFPTSGRATDPGLIAARSSGSRQPSSPPAAAQPVTAGHGQPRQPQPLPRLLGTVTATRRSNPGRSPRLPCSCLPLPSRTDSSAQQRQSPAFFPTSGRATDPGLIAARSSGSRQPSSPPAAAQPVTAGHGQPRQPQLLPRLLGAVTTTHRRRSPVYRDY
eukprot:XP_001702149.1 predicted protein [Chlamydomonas reinhardtii]